MSEPPLEEVNELFGRLVLVLTGKPANLIQAVLSNAVAASALASFDEHGLEPYAVARNIYRNSKIHIRDNLNARGVLANRPKGMKPN